MKYVIFTQNDRFFIPYNLEKLFIFEKPIAIIVLGEKPYSLSNTISSFKNKINLFGIQISLLLAVWTISKIVFRSKTINTVSKAHGIKVFFFSDINSCHMLIFYIQIIG